MVEAENQPEGLEFANINTEVTLDDFVGCINGDDEGSNASDDDKEEGNKNGTKD